MRSEYRALVDGLPALLRDFGCTLGREAHAELEVLMSAIDRVDQTLDSIADDHDRRCYAQAVLGELSGGEQACGLGELRALILRRGATEPFVRRTHALLDASEQLRATRDPREYVRRVEEEGRLMIELVLPFVAPHADERFVHFFRSLAELSNLLDKLVDARGDYRRGELALRPGIRLHARLAGRFLRRVPAALARHPRRLRLVAWGLAWLPRALRSAEAAG